MSKNPEPDKPPKSEYLFKVVFFDSLTLDCSAHTSIDSVQVIVIGEPSVGT